MPEGNTECVVKQSKDSLQNSVSYFWNHRVSSFVLAVTENTSNNFFFIFPKYSTFIAMFHFRYSCYLVLKFDTVVKQLVSLLVFWHCLAVLVPADLSLFICLLSCIQLFQDILQKRNVQGSFDTDMSVLVFRQHLACICSTTGVTLAVAAPGPLPCLLLTKKAKSLSFRHSLLFNLA